MRIAFFLSEFPDSSQTFILNQINGLLDRGHEVDIFADAPSRGEQVPQDDVQRYHLDGRIFYRPRMPRNPVLRAIRGLRLIASTLFRGHNLLRTVNPFRFGRLALSFSLLPAAIPLLGGRTYDVILAHFGPNGLKAALIRDLGLLSGRLVTVFHGHDVTATVKRYGRDYYKRLFATGDLFLPVCRKWEARLIELGCDPNRIIVHRMGIDCSAFTLSGHQRTDSGPVRLVSVAALVEKSGIEFAIRALAQMNRARTRIEYFIVGEGPLRDQLGELTRRLGVAQHVQWMGWKPQDEVLTILKESHIFLAPGITSADGDQEGIPVSLMEAMALGLPIVSTSHGGIPELVENGVTGVLVPERDVPTLARSVQQLIYHADRWSGLPGAGRQRVEELHDIDKLNDLLVELFQNLTASSKRSQEAVV